MRKARLGEKIVLTEENYYFDIGTEFVITDEDRWDDGTGVTATNEDCRDHIFGGIALHHHEYEIVDEKSDLRKAYEGLEGKYDYLMDEIEATDEWVDTELHDLHEELAAMDEAIAQLEAEMDEIKRLISPRAKRKTDQFRGGCI